jgi:RHS repeat-associated protein
VYDASGKMLAEYSIIVEPPSTAKASYLTTDHLGSPRILTDANGQVISRRDFHPFGEEIITAQRTQGLGYTADTIRKKFTSYERDIELDLDFAQARYYNFNHGRFTSSDPLLSSGRVEDPQTWNRYAYVLNNPLYYIDPDGLYECMGTKDQCTAFRDTLANAKAKLASIEKVYGKDSDEYKKTERALNAYGCESVGGNCVDANGKTITDANGKAVKDTSGIVIDFNFAGDGANTSLNGKIINISFTKNFSGSEPLYQGLVGNEGSNAADAQDFLATGKSVSQYQTEYDSAFVDAVISEFVARDDKNWVNYRVTVNPAKGNPYKIETWNKSWMTPDLNTVRNTRRESINAILAEDKNYELTPTNAKGRRPAFYIKK